jgi:hypothetical protein
MCGGFNINYIQENHKKLQLDSLLAAYSLYSTVTFPTRISGNSASLIDNIFIDTSKHRDYIICSVVNGLSHHDAQLLNLDKIITHTECTFTHIDRNINPSSTMDFKLNLSYESWDNVFLDEDMNVIFNNFLNTYLRIFNASFPAKKFLVKSNTKPWLTTGIRTSCLRKRELYLLTKHNNDPKLLNDYKLYCKVFSQVIKAAKKSYYNKYICTSVCGNIPTNAKRPFPRSTAVVGLPTTATSSSRQPIADGQASDGQA